MKVKEFLTCGIHLRDFWLQSLGEMLPNGNFLQDKDFVSLESKELYEYGLGL
jgi:hypothetical protein